MTDRSPAREMSVWEALTSAPARRPTARGLLEADVAIIGGGVAGLSTALHLSERGMGVALVEAQSFGAGATGASAGVVAPQLTKTTPDAVRKKLGEERSSRLLRLIAESGTHLFDLVARHHIDCAAVPAGFIAPRMGANSLTVLQDVVRQWAPIRTDLRIADMEEVTALTGCRGYRAALVDPTGGGIDPLALARGLADRAEALGARLYEGTPALQLGRAPGGWKIVLPDGEIVTRRVIVAANASNGGIHRALRGTMLPLPVVEVATEPLPAAMRARILPGNQALTDLELDVFSIRYTIDGRLVTAFPSSNGGLPEELEEKINRRLEETLVVHQPLRIDYAWLGQAAVNADLIPRIVRLDEGLLAVQACNGRGLGINTILGRELAAYLLGDRKLAQLPIADARPISGFLLARHIPRMLLATALFAKQLRRRLGMA